MAKLGRWLVRILAFLGAITVLGVVTLAFVVSYFFLPDEDVVPERAILELSIHDVMLDEQPQNIPAFVSTQLRLNEVLKAIEKASRDPRVHALWLEIGQAPGGLARVQELRDAIRAFRARGKIAVAFAESFGHSSGLALDYYLATAFDQVWMQPSGYLNLSGVAFVQPFLRELLDSVGIDVNVIRRGPHKTALNPFVERSMTPEERESLQNIGISWIAQIASGIAEKGDFDLQKARSLIEDGPYLASEALDRGLVDHLGYRNQARSAVLNAIEAGENAFTDLAVYHGYDTGEEHDDASQIALIHLTGMIDTASYDPLSTLHGAGAVAHAIEQAGKDSDIDAILLRIDSPGGGFAASDRIRQAIMHVRDQTGKPVIAWMGDVAASGAYLISIAADVIVAQPGTITGSIGVVAAKPVIADMSQNLGVRWDIVKIGKRADMWSPVRDFSNEEWQILARRVDLIYESFLGEVEKARSIDSQALQAIAGGRVWSGADAKRQDLIDELGGLNAALTVIGRKLERSASDLLIVDYPPVNPWDLLKSFSLSQENISLKAIALNLMRLSWHLPDGGLLAIAPILLHVRDE